ncbi:MAG: class D beta-lactamase [Blastocatellia bacterium]|nr:class D beta-lactamase [Blastocatellia bacterium]MBL8193781.1 class D beta-lactamase [Blastocatellia bacterium]
MMKLLGLLVLLLFFCGQATAQDLDKVFHNKTTAFAVYDLQKNSYQRYNEARCNERFSPFSTFKIPNSLIGLETSVVTNVDLTTTWDEEKYPRKNNFSSEWNRDHSLRSAFKHSVLWYYRELAKKIGPEKMSNYLTKINYGNHDISGGIDQFWLNSSLQISINEQITFLTALYKNQLPFSSNTVKNLKEIMLLEETADYKIYAKTGTGFLAENNVLCWLVGFVETKGNTYVFATNLSDSKIVPPKARVELTKQALKELGVLSK